MQTKLYLVRHVETIGNIEKRLTGRKDYELTPKGIYTVNQLTNYLKDIDFDKIYCSTSDRTYKTIEKLARLKNIEIEKKEALCEMYFGIYDGWKWEDVNRINPLINKKHIETNEIMCIPNQEETKQVEERMYNEIKHIVTNNKNSTILIASHGVAIETFLRKITGIPFVKKREEYSQHNGSINIVNYDSKNNKFQIELLNDTSYLK